MAVQHHIKNRIQIAPDSPWFSGHFPGNPILPGIAQLSLVFDTVRQAFHEKLCIKEVKKVKFKQIVKPNDTLEISATQDSDDRSVYTFHIKVDEKIACRGTMITKGQG